MNRLNKLTVLLAEDDPGVRSITAQALEKLDMNVVQVADGREALKLIREATEPFDILLTDYHMPKMSGEELIRTIRHEDIGPRLIVLVSALFGVREGAEELSLELGLCVLEKPLSAEIFLNVVKEVFEGFEPF